MSLASSLAFIVIPLVTGLLTKNFSVSSVFIFDIGVALAGILLAINISSRYRKIFNVQSKTINLTKAS